MSVVTVVVTSRGTVRVRRCTRPGVNPFGKRPQATQVLVREPRSRLTSRRSAVRDRHRPLPRGRLPRGLAASRVLSSGDACGPVVGRWSPGSLLCSQGRRGRGSLTARTPGGRSSAAATSAPAKRLRLVALRRTATRLPRRTGQGRPRGAVGRRLGGSRRLAASTRGNPVNGDSSSSSNSTTSRTRNRSVSFVSVPWPVSPPSTEARGFLVPHREMV